MFTVGCDKLGEDFDIDTVLALKELDGPSSTQFGHALGLAASSINSLLKKCREELVSKL